MTFTSKTVSGRFTRIFTLALVATTVWVAASTARAQHLWWDLRGQKEATCLYGEVTVLATHPAIYYCGANWHPGEPAGGYCGIQDNSAKERRTIFSIWDTTDKLHPKVTAADEKTLYDRFGGEGTGAHTHMLWDWKVGDTFQFFVRKKLLPAKDAVNDRTEVEYYVYDRAKKHWLHSATITCPVGGKKSVATIGGSINSFLENFAGRDKAVPRLALYRLWLGSSIDDLKCLTTAHGDGTWGELGDAYFLAAGDKAKLQVVFNKVEGQYGKPTMGGREKLTPISDKPLEADLIAELKNLPKAMRVETNKKR